MNVGGIGGGVGELLSFGFENAFRSFSELESK